MMGDKDCGLVVAACHNYRRYLLTVTSWKMFVTHLGHGCDRIANPIFLQVAFAVTMNVLEPGETG